MQPGPLAAATAALCCVLAQAPSQAAPALRISFTADIRSTQPGVNRDGNSDTIVPHVAEGLVAYGEDGDVRPMLAESTSISDEGKVYTFVLRKGVKFHNGATLSSEDVLWSWNHYMDPKTNWRCTSEFDGRGAAKVVNVQAPDAQTVVFTLDKPNGLFLSALARVDCGGTAILNKASLKADGSWDKPIGTGPFKLNEWKRGEYVSLTRFQDYANRGGKRDGYTGSKRPLVDEVRFVVVPDESTAKTALIRGDIDVIEDLSYSDVPVLKKESSVKIAHAPVMSMTGLLMQTQDPLLADVRMRRAVAHAIDYAQLVAAVTENMAAPNNSVVPIASPYYGTVQKKGWQYDPAQSQKLLKEAGYKGQQINIIATKRYPQSYNAAIMIQAMLQAAGMNAQLEVMEWATQLDRYNAGKYQMMAFPYSARMDAALNYEMLSGDKAKQPRKLWGNPQALTLIQQASISTDRAQRQRIFDELHTLFLADVPSIPLYNGDDIGAFRANIKGYQPWAVKRARGWEVERVAN